MYIDIDIDIDIDTSSFRSFFAGADDGR